MDDDGGADWGQQQDNEARRFQEEQSRKDAAAFDRLMDGLWGILRSQWKTETQQEHVNDRP